MDLICYSHLRWDFVYQRPQHILSRMAVHFRVFYIEEPIFDATDDVINHRRTAENVWVLVPRLRSGQTEIEVADTQKRLLKAFFDYFEISSFVAWYYTPMAFNISIGSPLLIVYDCMDELSAFKNAPALLKEKEKALFASADIIFTGGRSLHKAKEKYHTNIHLFPSSIDRAHFVTARLEQADVSEQAEISHPRIGFFGVVDERMDIALLAQIAALRPNYQFILLGPVVKIDPLTLPKAANIHWLGIKTYQELPHYIAGWEAAMMPFAINEATTYISPTKTPEYLAAGKPVVSTPIKDVVNEYGDSGLVYIAANAAEFVDCLDASLGVSGDTSWLKVVDIVLANNSWDITTEKMLYLINIAITEKVGNKKREKKKEENHV